MPKPIRELSARMLSEPHVVELAHTAPVETIEHGLYPIAEGHKRELLERVLAEDDCETAIVFTRTKHRAKRLALQLSRQRLRAVALQGNMSQRQRERAMSGFRQRRFDILVATDIAARGLDVAGIDYVINFDPPNTPETYTHRIGRTGRSGACGKACTFVTREDSAWVRETERALGARIPLLHFPGFPPETLELGSQRRRAGPAQRTRRASTTPKGSTRRGRRAGPRRNRAAKASRTPAGPRGQR